MSELSCAHNSLNRDEYLKSQNVAENSLTLKEEAMGQTPSYSNHKTSTSARAWWRCARRNLHARRSRKRFVLRRRRGASRHRPRDSAQWRHSSRLRTDGRTEEEGRGKQARAGPGPGRSRPHSESGWPPIPNSDEKFGFLPPLHFPFSFSFFSFFCIRSHSKQVVVNNHGGGRCLACLWWWWS